MKKLLTVILLVSSTLLAKAQSFDLEIGTGLPFAQAQSNLSFNGSVYLEGRFNLPILPLDLGLQVNYAGFEEKLIPPGATKSDKMNPWTVMAVADYKLLPLGVVEVFAGVGVGLTIDGTGSIVANKDKNNNFCFVPRIGVRALKHFSLSVDYEIRKYSFSRGNVRVGIYF